jgi:hypothetical protein
VNVWPPAVIVPDRAAPAFDAAENATLPEPVPEDPDVIVIHEAPGVAVHVQPEPAVTMKLPVPPLASTSCDVGLSA